MSTQLSLAERIAQRVQSAAQSSQTPSSSLPLTPSDLPNQDDDDLPPSTSNFVVHPSSTGSVALSNFARQLKEDYDLDHTSCAEIDRYCALSFEHRLLLHFAMDVKQKEISKKKTGSELYVIPNTLKDATREIGCAELPAIHESGKLQIIEQSLKKHITDLRYSIKEKIKQSINRKKRRDVASLTSDIIGDKGVSPTLALFRRIAFLIEVQTNYHSPIVLVSKMPTHSLHITTTDGSRSVGVDALVTYGGCGCWFIGMGLAGSWWFISNRYRGNWGACFIFGAITNQAGRYVGNGGEYGPNRGQASGVYLDLYGSIFFDTNAVSLTRAFVAEKKSELKPEDRKKDFWVRVDEGIQKWRTLVNGNAEQLLGFFEEMYKDDVVKYGDPAKSGVVTIKISDIPTHQQVIDKHAAKVQYSGPGDDEERPQKRKRMNETDESSNEAEAEGEVEEHTPADLPVGDGDGI
ncbi:hypothetical protein K435DRAFT_811488 [Dendrothele bispora CBS 962.96]|uniref:Uncharacterized protein n=1 Tax=Dendrothele bispora (strain CBS 962.96) TaxID=1314807 RepID=A0A4S8KRV0_DENBC|nr:hypothetical protein K435DRAFT_811488 [Dendrothele bispora CBS 962.96]